ncbi:MAG: hypothetical protein HYS25_00865 [Ignavibacteriales bacterium]|nr:hypothetical protein [Ignavibacteriales bacterium]
MPKLKFRNGINGTLETWTPQTALFNVGSVKRRIESKNPGEAGIIVFDKLGLTLDYEGGSNPVYNAFGGNLSAVQRYIFELHGIKSDRSTSKLFEGLCDFSTIEWPDLEKKISFNVLDKLSSLSLITQTAVRTSGNVLYDVNTDSQCNQITYEKFWDANDFSLYYTNSGGLVRQTINTNTPKLGETIQIHFLRGQQESEYAQGLITFKYFDPTFQDGKVFYGIRTNYQNWYAATTDQDKSGTVDSINKTNSTWWSDLFNAQDIYIKQYRTDFPITKYQFPGRITQYVAGWEIVAYDALKIIEAIVEKVWGNITIVNKTGGTTFPISLDYFSVLLDENPFGMHPLDALRMLAGSMQCYVFFNKNGELVLQKKSTISSGTVRSFTPVAKKSGGKKKYFWDKLADAVTVTVKSGKLVNGITLEGKATVKKYPGIQPRNEIKIEIVAPSTVEFTQTALDSYALTVATEVMDFYGKRHFYFNLSTRLQDDMYEWELLDLIDLNGERYFILSSEINETNAAANFELVSVTGYDYDYQQARAVLSLEKYNSISAYSTSSSSGGGVTISITAQQPIELAGSVVQLNYSDNFKLSLDNKLETIQDIKKTSTTTEFARIGFGGAPDLIYKVKNYGNEWILGNQKIDGVQAIGGEVDALYKQKIYGDSWLTGNQKIDGYSAIGGAIDASFMQKVYGNQKITGNLTVDGDIYIGGNINQVNVTELNVVDKIINLNVGGDNTTAINSGISVSGSGGSDLATIIYDGTNWSFNQHISLQAGGLFKINNVELLSSTTLGVTVINSSLTKVATLTQGTWNATAINGQYINYNATNLKVTANALNTIQDIASTSAPTFAQLTLSNQATLPTDAVRADRTINTTVPLSGGGNLTANLTLGLNYSATNLRVTINALNTIQDIHTSANPQFANLTLSGVATIQGTGTSNISSDLQHPNYISQLSKWKINNSGEADFRYLYVDEMHAKAFIADLEQALAGSQIICKSVAKVASDYSLPTAGSSSRLIVESFAGFETAAVFQNGDLIRLRQFSRTSGSLTISDAWGTVNLDTSYGASGFDTSTKTQAYTFTRHSSVPGTGSGTIKAGTLALDYGISGNGFVESNAIDGSWGQNSPYTQIATWNSTPGNYTIHSRTGNLRGITGVANEYGIILGSGIGINDKYLRASNQTFQLHNIPFDIYDGSTTTVNITTSGDMKLGTNIGGAATTSFDFTSSSGILRVGFLSASKANMYFDGTALRFRNNTFDRIIIDPISDSVTIGNASGYNTLIDSTSLSIRTASTVLATYGATTTIGKTGVSDANVNITSTAIQLRVGTTAKIQLNTDGSGFLANNNISWDAAGAASISEWLINQYSMTKTIGTSPNTKYLSLAARSISISGSGGNYPTIAIADNQFPMFVSMGHVYFKAGFKSEFGIAFAHDPFNSATEPLFQVTKNMSSGTLTAMIAGWNFDTTTLYGMNSSKYTGMQKPSALTTKCFFAGATDSIGNNSRFYVQADGKIVATDAAGNTLFNSDQVYADMKNIGRVFFSDHAVNTITATSYSTIKQGSVFFLPNETTVQLIYRAWISGTATTTGNVRLKLERTNQYPDNNSTIGNYETATYSNVVTVGDGSTSCFDYYHTIISTPAGEKFLYELKKNNQVYSFNEEKRCIEISEIDEIITAEAEEYFLLNGITRVTGEHPLFVNLSGGGWMKVRDMEMFESLDISVLKCHEVNLFWRNIEVKKQTGKLKVATLKMKAGSNPSFIADGFVSHNKGVAQAYALFGVCKIQTGLGTEKLYRWTVEGHTYNATYPLKVDNIILTTGRNAFSQATQTTGF